MAVQMEKPMRVTPHHAVTSCEVWCRVRDIFSSELLSRNETRSQSGRYLSQHHSQGWQLIQEKLWGSQDSPRNTHGRRISPAGPGSEHPVRSHHGVCPQSFLQFHSRSKQSWETPAQRWISSLPSLLSKPSSSPPARQLHPESAALH